jgi:hypothetical protein
MAGDKFVIWRGRVKLLPPRRSVREHGLSHRPQKVSFPGANTWSSDWRRKCASEERRKTMKTIIVIKVDVGHLALAGAVLAHALV